MALKRDKFDAVVSDLVREAAGKCEHCHKVNVRLECAHIYGRRNKAVRWDLDNLVSLCHYCHRYTTENPHEFILWLDGYLGSVHMEILREKNNQIKRWKKQELDQMYKHYKAELARVRDYRSLGITNPIDVESYQ